MLPASDIADILENLSALNLQPNTAAQILAAVLAPLLRSADPDPPALPRKRVGRPPRSKPRRAARRSEESPGAGGGQGAQGQSAFNRTRREADRLAR